MSSFMNITKNFIDLFLDDPGGILVAWLARENFQSEPNAGPHEMGSNLHKPNELASLL